MPRSIVHAPRNVKSAISKPRATALEDAVAYVRSTMYDVRFINNVRVAQIFFGSLTYAEIPLDPSS